MKTTPMPARLLGRILAAALGMTATLMAAQSPKEPQAGLPAVNQEETTETKRLRFVVADVFLDSGAAALAAYQLDIAITNVPAKIVGIEGGEHPAFRQPPYYDPEAIQRERVILAAYNTAPAADLPKGKTRVASLHLQVSGTAQARFSAEAKVAAGADGKPVPCTIEVLERNTP